MKIMVKTKSKRLRRPTFKGLIEFLTLKFSQIISEGHGAISMVQFYRLIVKHEF